MKKNRQKVWKSGKERYLCSPVRERGPRGSSADWGKFIESEEGSPSGAGRAGPLRPGGKPRLREGPCFSLSHSGELVFCAVSDAELGCDVQKIPETEPDFRVVERCLSEGEKRLYAGSGNRRELFTVLWSLKESYAKMDGAGLGQLSPAGIGIELSPAGSAAVAGSSAKLWYRVEGDYVFSLCSEKYGTPQEFGPVDSRVK